MMVADWQMLVGQDLFDWGGLLPNLVVWLVVRVLYLASTNQSRTKADTPILECETLSIDQIERGSGSEMNRWRSKDITGNSYKYV